MPTNKLFVAPFLARLTNVSSLSCPFGDPDELLGRRAGRSICLTKVGKTGQQPNERTNEGRGVRVRAQSSRRSFVSFKKAAPIYADGRTLRSRGRRRTSLGGRKNSFGDGITSPLMKEGRMDGRRRQRWKKKKMKEKEKEGGGVAICLLSPGIGFGIRFPTGRPRLQR